MLVGLASHHSLVTREVSSLGVIMSVNNPALEFLEGTSGLNKVCKRVLSTVIPG